MIKYHIEHVATGGKVWIGGENDGMQTAIAECDRIAKKNGMSYAVIKSATVYVADGK